MTDQMTAPDEKALRATVQVVMNNAGLYSVLGGRMLDAAREAIAAALIEARRATLEEAADACRQSSVLGTAMGNGAARIIRALIPTRPDGAAEGVEK